MSYVSTNYTTHADAPLDKWVCTRTSNLGPFSAHPPQTLRGDPDYCGQCVSYVTTVCPTLPVKTSEWKRGSTVKDNPAIIEGTAIATFNGKGHYTGHAAIYVSQDHQGIHVYDQWITGAGKPVGPRLVKWNGVGTSNNGHGFYVIE